MSGLTFTSGQMVSESIQAVTIHLGLGKGVDMDGWHVLIESTIDAIRVDALRKQVEIEVTCMWNGKSRKRIVACGVDDFSVGDMRLSNVIDRASFFDPAATDGDESGIAERLFVLMRGQEPSASDLDWPILKEKLARIHAGELTWLELEPVYGATVAILAQSIRLENI